MRVLGQLDGGVFQGRAQFLGLTQGDLADRRGGLLQALAGGVEPGGETGAQLAGLRSALLGGAGVAIGGRARGVGGREGVGGRGQAGLGGAEFVQQPDPGVLELARLFAQGSLGQEGLLPLAGKVTDALGGVGGAAGPFLGVALQGLQPLLAAFPLAALHVHVGARLGGGLARGAGLGPGGLELGIQVVGLRQGRGLGAGRLKGGLGFGALGVEAGDGLVQ